MSQAKIPLSRVVIDDEVKAAVLRAVESGQYILGPESKAFEQELAGYFGRAHGVLVSSATAGLMLTLQALGIGPGDEVLAPSQTAFPTIEAIFLAGATPVFVDTDDSGCLDPSWIEPRITPRTKAILPVHLTGHPCDLDALQELVARHHLLMIEDCAQAHGAEWRGKRVGRFGRAGVLSFYPSKNLTVLGDGGAVVTDDGGLAARLRMLRDHGRRDKYQHEIVGWNLRFNEIQAAAGRVFLRRLDAMNEARRRVAARYAKQLEGGPVLLPREHKLAKHVYHLFVIRTPDAADRDALAKHLAADGIQTGVHYPLPNHLQPATTNQRGVRAEALPHTEEWVKQILSLPCFPAMTEAEVDRVAASILAYYAKRG